MRPQPIVWDALIATALERGKAVPEVPASLFKPGEDAALEVGCIVPCWAVWGRVR